MLSVCKKLLNFIKPKLILGLIFVVPDGNPSVLEGITIQIFPESQSLDELITERPRAYLG